MKDYREFSIVERDENGVVYHDMLFEEYDGKAEKVWDWFNDGISRYRKDAEEYGKWADEELANGQCGAARIYKMTQEQYTAFADKLQRVLDGKHKRIAVE